MLKAVQSARICQHSSLPNAHSYIPHQSKAADINMTDYCRFTEMMVANDCAHVPVLAVPVADRSPATPLAGQTILVPPCIWASGCAAVLPINTTAVREEVLFQVRKQYPEAEGYDPHTPGLLGSGATVGPPMAVYVLPCQQQSCGGITRGGL